MIGPAGTPVTGIICAMSHLSTRLALDFCGLKLDSPIVLLSGCVGFGEEYTRIEGFSNATSARIVPQRHDA